MTEPFVIAQRDDIRCCLQPDKANRHGLITGATGTGKTITLQNLAESFSRAGVPVFMADIKGDLTGISQAGTLGTKLGKIIAERKLPTPDFAAFPVTLWDVFGEQGYPVRATVSDLGPLLLSPMLNIADFMQTDGSGKGVVNVLAADQLMNAPRLYATFLLWLLSELFENLPEVGDLDKPKLVFFFDEAHLFPGHHRAGCGRSPGQFSG